MLTFVSLLSSCAWCRLETGYAQQNQFDSHWGRRAIRIQLMRQRQQEHDVGHPAATYCVYACVVIVVLRRYCRQVLRMVLGRARTPSLAPLNGDVALFAYRRWITTARTRCLAPCRDALRMRSRRYCRHVLSMVLGRARATSFALTGDGALVAYGRRGFECLRSCRYCRHAPGTDLKQATRKTSLTLTGDGALFEYSR